MKSISRHLSIALEVVGCCIVLLGVGIEVYMGAQLGFILITAGAGAVALGAMIFTKLIRK